MDTGGTFIDFLSSCSAASNECFLYIILKQIAVMHTLLKLLSLPFCNPKINHILCSFSLNNYYTVFIKRQTRSVSLGNLG